MSSLKFRIKLTNECSNNCWYCYSDAKNTTIMTDNMLDLVLNKFKQIYYRGGFSRIKAGITGGDPYSSDISVRAMVKMNEIFKDIPLYVCGDVCQCAKEENLLGFIKNGGVCLASLNEDPIENVMKQVKLINKRLYVFNVILTDYNMDRIDAILDQVLKYNLPLRLDHLFGPDNSESLNQKMVDCVNYIYPILINSSHSYNIYNMTFGNIHGRTPMSQSYCGYGIDQYYVNVDGFVRRCQMTDVIGHITDNDIDNKIKIEVPLPTDNCLSCDVFSYCHGGCPVTNVNGKHCDVLKTACTYLKNDIFTDKFYKEQLFKWKL